MDKRKIIIAILTILSVGSLSFNVYLALPRGIPEYKKEMTLKFGAMYIAADVDPQFGWDTAAHDFSLQIWEGLFSNDLSDPSLKLIPQLATSLGSYSPDGKNLTIPLRKGVKFHDGSPFNAAAVKFSFDRLACLMNVTGTLPYSCFYGIPTIIKDLYKWPDGTPIIKSIEIIDTFMVKFVLNRPYGPFRHLLTFPGSFILSPVSTPSNDYINPYTAGPDTCVGTGPFVLEQFILDYKAEFRAFENYWQGQSQIDNLIFQQIKDCSDRYLVLLLGGLDIIQGIYYSTDYEEIEENANITKDYTIGWRFRYLSINNNNINATWRKAISYAINYTHVMQDLYDNTAIRSNGFLVPSIFGYNSAIQAPYHNLTYAREVMMEMGFGNTTWNDNQWRAAKFASWNFSYIYKDEKEIAMYSNLKEDLDLIGINLTESEESLSEIIKTYPYIMRDWYVKELYKRQNIFLRVDWADYSDALNVYNWVLSVDFNSVFTPNLPLLMGLNDSWLQDKLYESSIEVNDTKRLEIYSEIQQYINEESFPIIYLFHIKSGMTYSTRIKHILHHPNYILYAFPINIEE